jgi:hypothetical protein
MEGRRAKVKRSQCCCPLRFREASRFVWASIKRGHALVLQEVGRQAGAQARRSRQEAAEVSRGRCDRAARAVGSNGHAFGDGRAGGRASPSPGMNRSRSDRCDTGSYSRHKAMSLLGSLSVTRAAAAVVVRLNRQRDQAPKSRRRDGGRGSAADKPGRRGYGDDKTRTSGEQAERGTERR